MTTTINDKKKPFAGRTFYVCPTGWSPASEYKNIQQVLKKGQGQVINVEDNTCCYVVNTFYGVSRSFAIEIVLEIVMKILLQDGKTVIVWYRVISNRISFKDMV
jgi:hypothetical protein